MFKYILLNITPKPFYWAFALTLIGVIADIATNSSSFFNEISTQGGIIVWIGILIRLIVGSLFWGSIFLALHLLFKRFSKDRNL